VLDVDLLLIVEILSGEGNLEKSEGGEREGVQGRRKRGGPRRKEGRERKTTGLLSLLLLLPGKSIRGTYGRELDSSVVVSIRLVLHLLVLSLDLLLLNDGSLLDG